MQTSIRRYVPFWLSLAVGIALWEVAGRSTSAAFMVPFSATLVRLWELIVAGEFLGQLAESAKLFFTGFVLALLVGIPLGMLLARVRALRIGIEPYLMLIYATPLVALIPPRRGSPWILIVVPAQAGTQSSQALVRGRYACDDWIIRLRG